MSYCRFQYQNVARYGLIEKVRGVETITRTMATAPRSWPEFEGAERSDLPLGEARLLSPVEPSKVVCIGRNYREHAIELNHPIPTEPLIFLKPPSSVIATGDNIRRPHTLSQRVDHEGELGVVIGKRCYRLRQGDDVRPYILGYTCVNDVTARDLQEKDGQWTRAKGFDTFCPVLQEMNRLVSQAELRALQSQINPHFLFNALNTLYGTIPREANGARHMVLNLAEIFRYFLQSDRT